MTLLNLESTITALFVFLSNIKLSALFEHPLVVAIVSGLIILLISNYISKIKARKKERIEVYNVLYPLIQQLKLNLYEAFEMSGHGVNMKHLFKIEADINPLLEKLSHCFGILNRRPIDELLNLLKSISPLKSFEMDEDSFKKNVVTRVEMFIALKSQFKLNA